jgi:hypothetical protein
MDLAKHVTLTILAILLIAGSSSVVAQPQQPSIAERVGAIKATLVASQVNLRHYEWIETTVVTLKGDEKSRKQMRCYYGAEGALQKVEISASPEAEQKRGLRGMIAERKKEELTDYMQNAVSLVKTYVPPQPIRLQAVADAGRVGIDVLEPGKRIRLNFNGYEKPGDNLRIDVDLVNNRALGVTVFTYLDDVKDGVILMAQMGQLNDGTAYPSDITLDADAKKIRVAVKNSGYRQVN